jgi:hypothetical protein
MEKEIHDDVNDLKDCLMPRTSNYSSLTLISNGLVVFINPVAKPR